MSDLERFVYVVPLLVVSLVVHELAHAVVATRLGDPTPREHGRLTLNPISHLDPMGSLVFVATFWLAPFPFGWARPVLVQPGHFRRPKEGMALVAIAGPLTNFLLALGVLALVVHGDLGERADAVLTDVYIINLVLGVFNLVPIPPLDGSRVVAVAMDAGTYERWRSLDQYGMVVIFALIFLFRDAFWEVLTAGIEAVHDVNLILVGAG